jgi:hypothetical protein
MSRSSLLHLFDFDRYPPSIERLPAALTTNSITKYPTFRYKGGDASAGGWAPWGYGSKLTLRDTLTTYNQGSPLLGPLDDSVMFNGDGYFISTTNIGNITTEDFVVEILMDFSSGTYYSFGNYTSGSAGAAFVMGGPRTGNIMNYRISWQTDYCIGYQNEVPMQDDSSCPMPTLSLSQIDIGASYTAGYEANCLISNLKIFGTPTLKK